MKRIFLWNLRMNAQIVFFCTKELRNEKKILPFVLQKLGKIFTNGTPTKNWVFYLLNNRVFSHNLQLNFQGILLV